MKTKLRFLIMLVLIGFNTLYGQFSADRPDLRLCGSPPNYYLDYYNCASNNYTLVDVFLSLTDVNGVPLNNTTCTIGTPQDLYVMLDYTSNSASAVHHARMFADLNIEGQGTVQLNVDFRTVQPGAGQIALYGPFTWVCGQEITLSRILIVWRTNGDDTELVPYDCSSYNKTQCDLPDNIAVTAPLAVEFDYTACTVGSSTTVNFNSTTSGGTPPYTYAWDFDNNGTTDSTLENPTFVYDNSMGYYAELTVTDDLGLSNSYLLPIVFPTEIQITSSISTVGCSTSNDGAIDITVNGGTPPYNYLWSNVATTEDISNLTPGNYSVEVTDSFGCIKIASFTILNGDTTPPVVTITPDETLEGCSTAIIDVTDLPYSSVATTIDLTTFQSVGGTITDDSSISSISYIDTQTGTCPIVVTRTYTVLDACNNSASISKNFTIDDTTPPTFVEALPADVTVECNAVPTPVTLTATDVCGTATVTYNQVRTDGTCTYEYTLTRTWTATDECGNTTIHNQVITVQDNSNPTFVETLPADVTVECNAIPTPVTLTATDVCGTATVTYNQVRTDGTCTYEYTLTRTWTATDECGNTTIHNQVITVQDNSNPTFVESLPTDVTVECNAIPTPVTLTATDVCGTATVTYNQVRTDGTCTYEYTLTRTWIATDECGNTTIHNQVITVQDNSNPTFVETLPADVTVECNAIPTPVTLTATDVCGTATVTYNQVRTDGTCSNDYTLTRTWTATDECGNTTIHNQVITVQDNSNPTFVESLPADVTVECNAVPTPVTLTATDVCGTATVTYNQVRTDGTCTYEYTLTRTWTATDECGNTTIHNQVITVQDNSNPTFVESLPADVTVECNAIPTPVTLTATDVCGTATVTYNQVRTDGTCTYEYTLTRTWTATDECGNTTIHNQVITVQDNSNPTFVESLPADVTVECNAIPTPVTLTATDVCGTATVTYNQVRTDGTCTYEYTLTRTWTATDECGNTTIHNQVITVQDNSNPTFVEALPTDVTVECNAVPTPVTLTATDVCGTATVTYNQVRTDGTCTYEYTLTRTWTATDECGNTTIHNQVITVQDNSNPTFVESLPANVTVECNAVPTPVTLTATDVCGTATVTYNQVRTDGTCANEYTLTRTWTATDECGNTTIHNQVITVQDNSNPTFVESLPADVTIECNTTIPIAATLTATDVCGTATVTFNEQIINGSCDNESQIIRTWTATDACGNVTTHTQTITIQDTTPPVFTGIIPNPVIYAYCDGIPAVATVTASDNCGATTISFNEVRINGECINKYDLNRTWTAEDDCGNIAIFTQVVHVACDIKIYNAVSPNNDGMNDIFYIEGIDCYPNNSVEIYNRWGVKIYTAVGYDNVTKVFSGYSNEHNSVSGNDLLPAGTYFYILKYEYDLYGTQKQNIEKSGYLYIQSK